MVAALTVLDDGGGPALVAGGKFTHMDENEANSIAVWNGETWSPLGDGLRFFSDTYGQITATVYAMALHDDGSGPALYVAGNFTHAGEIEAVNVAKWDPSTQTWSALGEGLGTLQYPFNERVTALQFYDDSIGPRLYATGHFRHADHRTISGLAVWDGVSWSGADIGLAIAQGSHGSGEALAVFNDGTGDALFVGGDFSMAGGKPSAFLAKWTCPFFLGDLNCDGAFDSFDIEPFILALFDPGEYAKRYPDCDINSADINGDGSVDAFDIEPFLELLFGG
jgi:hypothetical protein